jgi:hypothetical protein
MNTPADLRVYVNERGVSVPHGSIALAAVRALFPDQADAIVAGTMRLTDSRGLPVSHELALSGGSIFRVVPVRERLEDAS